MLAHVLRPVKYVLTSDSNKQWKREEKRSNRASQNSVPLGVPHEMRWPITSGAARDEFQGKEAPPTLFPRFPFSLFVAGRASDRIKSLFFDILIFEQEHYGIEV